MDAESDAPPEDTALSELTPEDRERLAIDAWEPTLLRKLLEAEERLPPTRPGLGLRGAR